MDITKTPLKVLIIFLFIICHLIFSSCTEEQSNKKGANYVSTLAGRTDGWLDGLGGEALFSSPNGIVIDNDDVVFVIDMKNNRVRRILPNGLVSTFAGSGISGSLDGLGNSAEFNLPFGIALGQDGILYIADTFNHKIRKITKDGTVTTIAGSVQGYSDGEGSVAKFNFPKGIAVDSNNTVIVADTENNCIRKIDSTGTTSTIAGQIRGYENGLGVSARFNKPRGVVSKGGLIFVCDTDNNCIRQISKDGEVSTYAGNESVGYKDGPKSTALFNTPSGISLGNDFSILVSDTYNNCIRKISSTGIVSTMAGKINGNLDGKGQEAKFNLPSGVTQGKDGSIYVADSHNHLIRKISTH